MRPTGADRTVDRPRCQGVEGSGLPTTEQGVRILGTPVGHPDFVQAFPRKALEEHDVLRSRIPMVEDVQLAWALLLHCTGGRANYMLRVVRPEAIQTFAEGHTDGLWRSFRNISLSLSTQIQRFGTLPRCFCLWAEPKRRSYESCRILGKLGRLPFHDPSTTR